MFEASLYGKKDLIRRFISYLLGGVISGLCLKKGRLELSDEDLSDFLICPACKENNQEVRITRQNNEFTCPACMFNFPEEGGVIFLFTGEKLKELYPDLRHKTA
jgi:uncharacterized protein YbaR (Trm112 family)